MNSLVQVHMTATFFESYQVLRDELMEILTDDDLGFRVEGTNASLGALCREIGEIEHSYVESFKTFQQDFDYRKPGSGRREERRRALVVVRRARPRADGSGRSHLRARRPRSLSTTARWP
jgi:hypothetical protein